MTTPAELRAGALPTGRETSLWAGAAAFVVAAHLAVAYAFAALAPAPEPPDAIEQALTVDLTPFMITQPEAVESEALTEEKPDEIVEQAEDAPLPVETAEAITEADPEELVEDKPEPTETEEVQAEPDVAEPEIAEAEIIEPEVAEPEVVEKIEPIQEAPKPEVVLPQPKPKVVKEAPKAKPKPVQKKVAKAEAKPKPVAKAKPAPKSTASAKSTASKAKSVSPARWHSQVYAAIARRKPRGRGISGNVSVRFVVSSSGAVVSAGVARSSGNAKLDGAALAMVRGARIPAPPPGLPGSRHPFTVPVSFQ